MVKSFDIKLAGEPYMFAGPGISLGDVAKEPAPIGQLGSIIIPSLDGGVGAVRGSPANRYVSATNAVVHEPGLVLPEGAAKTTIGTLARGTTLYPWTIAYLRHPTDDIAFLVGPKKLYWFDPHAASPTLTEVTASDLSGLSGDKYYTGSCFVWNGKWIFGMEGSDRSAAGHVSVSVPASTIAYDSASHDSDVLSSSLTFSHNWQGSNRMLVVTTHSLTNIAVSSVTYGGASLTQLATIANPAGPRTEMWYIRQGDGGAPGVGASNIVVTWASSGQVIAGATSWTGVHQTTSWGTAVTAEDDSETPSVAVSSAQDEVVVDGVVSAGLAALPSLAVGTDQTERWRDTVPANYLIAGGSSEPGASTTTMSWTTSLPSATPFWAMVAAPIKPVTPGGQEATAVVTDDTTEGVSFGAAQRGRAFWVRNKGSDPMEVYWAPQQNDDFEDGAFTKYGPVDVETILVTKVVLWGGMLLIVRADGSVLGTDETGFVALAQPPAMVRDNSPDNPMLSVSFGREATPYLDSLLLPAGDGVWGLSPQTLATRPFAPDAIQQTDADELRGLFLAAATVGTQAFLGGQEALLADGTGDRRARIYRLAATPNNIVAHHFAAPLDDNSRVVSLKSTVAFSNDRDLTTYLLALVDTGTNVKLYRFPLRTEHSAGFVGAQAPAIQLPHLSGEFGQENMTKLFLQVRGRWSKGGGTALQFATATVDGNAVNIPSVAADGEFSQAISASPSTNLIGRSIYLLFTLAGAAADTTLYLPMAVDFLWAPALHDLITISVIAGESVGRVSNILARTSGKDAVDALMLLRNTIIAAEFPEGSTGVDVQKGTVAWNLFVESVDVNRNAEMASGLGRGQYAVSLRCRRL